MKGNNGNIMTNHCLFLLVCGVCKTKLMILVDMYMYSTNKHVILSKIYVTVVHSGVVRWPKHLYIKLQVFCPYNNCLTCKNINEHSVVHMNFIQEPNSSY